MGLTLSKEQQYYISLYKKEGWDVEEKKERKRDECPVTVTVQGKHSFGFMHPYAIHLTLYRREPEPAIKLKHLIAAHNYLWPNYVKTWNHWDERRFAAHCDGYDQIVLAGGAGAGKSSCAARIACLFWLSAPLKSSVVVASTTLDSLESRIWGYVANFMNNTACPIPATVLRSKPPKVVHPQSVSKIYGMFAAAAAQGDDEKIIARFIGRHPEMGLIVILDEATDIPAGIIKAVPNLEKGQSFFQLWAIGNSSSQNDLHGALATPGLAGGWDAVDPMRDYIWPTTHRNGVCLYFNPYDSPAIKEPDPAKRALLGNFLITEDQIEADKKSYGEMSETFWRFTMGFWKRQAMAETLATGQFLTEYQVLRAAEFSGFYPLEIVAGLDPAFSVGSQGCVLRLAVLGHTVDGLMVLDFRGDELLFRININVSVQQSSEMQVALGVLDVLKRHRCPLINVALDATGPGRALADLIVTVGHESGQPIRIVSAGRTVGAKKKGVVGVINDVNTHVFAPTDMWNKFREFIIHKQIKGLDVNAVEQFTGRLMKPTKRGGPAIIEPKSDYIARMGAINPRLAHSPDEADSVVLATFAAIMRFGFSPGQKRSFPNEGVETLWQQKLKALEIQKQMEQAGGGARWERPALVPNFSSDLEDVI